MLRSLRFRLVLTIVGLTVVVATAVSLLTALATRHEFSRFVEVESTGPAPIDPADVGPLASHFERVGDWSGVEPVLRALAERSKAIWMLFDADGVLVVSTSSAPDELVRLSGDETLEVTRGGALSGDEQRMVVRGALHIDQADGRTVGLLFRLPDDPDPELSPESGFTRSVVRWHYLAVAGGAVLALILGLALSRSVVGPVERLTRAARAMERGDLGAHVEVRSSDEIGELAGAFISMSAAIERQERLRRGMVSDVAHELRTPLTHMRCRLEAVQDGLAATSDDLVSSLHEEVLHLGRLVDDLQELALAEAGRLHLAPESVGVDAAIRQVAEAQPSAADARLAIDVPRNLPPVLVDPDRFRQVLRNLLSNALRHAGAGGRVTVEASDDGDMVRVRVSDSGPGIAPEHLPNVFERFYRADTSRATDPVTGRPTGLGLGLTIARELLTASNGRVAVERTGPAGTTFVVEVPAADT